eukprot:364323-Chlamydomonas_euryale.AAC.1
MGLAGACLCDLVVFPGSLDCAGCESTGKHQKDEVRNVHALAAFRQFQDVWASPKLSEARKRVVYCTFILPMFLYSCKTWTQTEVQMDSLRSHILTVSATCRRKAGRPPPPPHEHTPVLKRVGQHRPVPFPSVSPLAPQCPLVLFVRQALVLLWLCPTVCPACVFCRHSRFAQAVNVTSQSN